MIFRTGERYTPQKSTFDIQKGMPPEDVLDVRLRFVKDMKWFPEGYSNDWDVYDAREDTYHFTRRDDNESVIASMRLTPTESIEKSLSYEMLSENSAFQFVVRAAQEEMGDGAIWDLTRLVFPLDGRHDTKTIHASIVELFGMAARVSAGQVENAEKDVHWVFTTTPWTMRFFNQTGIKSTTLAEGKLPNADGELKTTLFCLVDVASAIEALKTSDSHRDTYDRLRKGAEAVEAATADV